jgi:hypothetical protein
MIAESSQGSPDSKITVMCQRKIAENDTEPCTLARNVPAGMPEVVDPIAQW